MVKVSSDKVQLKSDRISGYFEAGNTWHGAFSDWKGMSHVSCVNTILGLVYTRWATPGLDWLMHCSLFEIPVAQAQFSARGPVRLQHNENFKRKHGMSRASPADRAGSSQTNRPVDRCHTSNFTRAASKAVETEGFPSLALNSAHMNFDVRHGFNSGEQNSCS